MLGMFRGKPDPEALAASERIKATTRRLLGLDEDTTVSVNEIACGDPACPGGVETVILIRAKGHATKAVKLPGGLALASDAALERALGAAP